MLLFGTKKRYNRVITFEDVGILITKPCFANYYKAIKSYKQNDIYITFYVLRMRGFLGYLPVVVNFRTQFYW